MAEQGGGDEERSHDPSERKLQKARDEGRFAQSRDLSFLMLAVLAAGFAAMAGSGAWQACMRLMREGLDLRLAQDPMDLLQRWSTGALLEFGLWLFAFLGAALLLGVAAPLALAGLRPVFAPRFDLNRLDPVAGLGRMFSAQNLFALAKGVGVTLLMLAVGGAFIWLHAGALRPQPGADAATAVQHLGQLLALGGQWLLVVLLLVGATDAAFQWRNFRQQMRMTLQEMKDENKESEGSPEVRARIRSLQRDASRRRMMAAVEQADVLVVNPTHYAVALRYDPARMAAPTVVAKGEDEVALRLRDAAKTHAVPVAASPALARWLHAQVPLGQPVPAAVYAVAAQLLAWAYEVKAGRHDEAVPDVLDAQVAALGDQAARAPGSS